MQQVMALVALVILYVFFAIFGNRFATADTFVSILDSSYYIGFLAIGMTFVIFLVGDQFFYDGKQFDTVCLISLCFGSNGFGDNFCIYVIHYRISENISYTFGRSAR